MKKTLIALTMLVGVIATVLVTTVDADASSRSRRFWTGVAVGAGVVAVGAALAPRYQPYAVQQGYQAYPTYVAAYPVDCPGGYWARRPIRNEWGQVVAWGKPRFFCPAY